MRLKAALDAALLVKRLARSEQDPPHANAKVTGQIYAGVSEDAKAKIATKLTDAGFGS